MNEGKSYAARVELDQVMVGGTVGEVVASRHPKLKVGDVVVGVLGWQEYALSKGEGVMKVDPKEVPLAAYLGAVGMPGVTAWYGLFDIGKPKPGETVVVAAASGAVGSVVGQLAKIHGCRAIGIAGGKDKCDYVTGELGFDACLDHHDPSLKERFREATPGGVDVYFENVGGAILDMVLARLNAFARIPLCGLVSQYNATEPYGVKNFASLLMNRVTLQGFIVSEHMERWPTALAELAGHVAEGRIKFRESIAEGLDNAPAAFIGMLEGKNFGKQLVKIA
jgi:NADPH-dependent curcumin reductase CurA